MIFQKIPEEKKMEAWQVKSSKGIKNFKNVKKLMEYVEIIVNEAHCISIQRIVINKDDAGKMF